MLFVKYHHKCRKQAAKVLYNYLGNSGVEKDMLPFRRAGAQPAGADHVTVSIAEGAVEDSLEGSDVGVTPDEVFPEHIDKVLPQTRLPGSVDAVVPHQFVRGLTSLLRQGAEAITAIQANDLS